MKLPDLPRATDNVSVNVYIPQELLSRIDRIVERGGYRSRSVVIRSFLEATVAEFEDQTLRMEQYVATKTDLK